METAMQEHKQTSSDIHYNDEIMICMNTSLLSGDISACAGAQLCGNCVPSWIWS